MSGRLQMRLSDFQTNFLFRLHTEIELPPATSWWILYRLKLAKEKTSSTEILTRVNPKYLHIVCILKSSPEGEGFSPRVRQ
jgi:hypothetical protein